MHRVSPDAPVRAGAVGPDADGCECNRQFHVRWGGPRPVTDVPHRGHSRATTRIDISWLGWAVRVGVS